MKKITICRYQVSLFALIFVLLSVGTLIYLGNWQMRRLHEKESFIKTIEYNLLNPALEIHEVSPDFPKYSKVKLSGKFLSGKNAYLYGRRSASPEKDGYYLLSSFQSEDGEIYLVSRAWIPQSTKDNMHNFVNQETIETIEAIILPSEKKNFFVPENDNVNNIWFTLDAKASSKALNNTMKGFYLMQINSTYLPENAISLKPNHLSKIRNDHLEYAITWYSLAACLVLMFIIYNRNNNK